MSFCPTCPTCGAFAPWEVSASEVRKSDTRGWPVEEYITSYSIVRGCVNGHLSVNGCPIGKPRTITTNLVDHIISEAAE